MKHPSRPTIEAATAACLLAAHVSLLAALGVWVGAQTGCSSGTASQAALPDTGQETALGEGEGGSPGEGADGGASGATTGDAATTPTTPDATAPEASTLAPSPCGTAVPPAAQIVDAQGNVWTLTASAQIARNGVMDPVTQKVVLLVYVGGVVYQNAYDAWWGWENGAWQTASDPRVGAACTDAGNPGMTALPDGGLPYMIGFGGAGQTTQQIAAAEMALGRPFDLGSSSVTVDSYENGPYVSSNGRTIGMVLIFEMLSESWDSNQSLQDMSAAASGAYDSVYTQMAKSIAASGAPPVSVRIGHEMNGNWYPWSATDGNTHNATTANYIATFQRIAQIVRTYNPSTSIEWCAAIQPNVPSWSGTSYTPIDYWVGAYDPVKNPGGADVITMDFYEGLSGTDFTSDIEGGQFGLTWLASFAAQNNVKLGLSEVATGTGSSPGEGNGCPCSNDGAFMQGMVSWINALPAGQFQHFVFSAWAPADDLASGGNAAIQGVWKQSWGGTYFAGSWWKGPKVPTQP